MPGQLVVHPEVVLDGDGGERLRLALHLHPLLRLDRLVQPVGPAAARQDAAGELVHDEDLPVLHDVLHVLLVQGVGPQQLVDDVQLLALGRVVRLRSAGAAPASRPASGCRPPAIAVHLLREVGHDEERGVVRRDRVSTPLSVRWTECALLVEDEVQHLLELAELLLLAGSLRSAMWSSSTRCTVLLDALLVEELQQPLVLRHAELRLVRLRRRWYGLARPPTAAPPRRRDRWRSRSAAAPARLPGCWTSAYLVSLSVPTGPEMMSGVRASSIRIESTSSMMAYVVARAGPAAPVDATMLSRR